MKYTAWDYIGFWVSVIAVIELFFDELPFSTPWGLLFGAVGIGCLRMAVRERHNV